MFPFLNHQTRRRFNPINTNSTQRTLSTLFIIWPTLNDSLLPQLESLTKKTKTNSAGSFDIKSFCLRFPFSSPYCIQQKHQTPRCPSSFVPFFLITQCHHQVSILAPTAANVTSFPSCSHCRSPPPFCSFPSSTVK